MIQWVVCEVPEKEQVMNNLKTLCHRDWDTAVSKNQQAFLLHSTMVSEVMK